MSKTQTPDTRSATPASTSASTSITAMKQSYLEQAKEHDKLFDAKYAHKADAFAATPHWKAEAQEVAKTLPEKGVVLDLGCNTGRFIEEHAREGLTYVGMDVNVQALNIAQTRLPNTLFVGSLKVFSADTFDHVVFMHAINQVHDLDGLMMDVWRVMKRGGRIAVMTHNPLYSLRFVIKNLFNGYKPDSTMVREPRLGQLKHMMYEYGFVCESAEYVGPGAIDCMKPRLLYVGRKA